MSNDSLKEQIVALLQEHGFPVDFQENKMILMSLPTEIYQDKAGDNAIPILITTTQKDQVIMVIVPFAYTLTEEVNVPMIQEFLLIQNMCTPLIKFGFDPNDGEIQLRVDIMLEGTLNIHDFRFAFAALKSTLESVHPRLVEMFAHKPTFAAQEKEKAQDIINSILEPISEETSDDDDFWL